MQVRNGAYGVLLSGDSVLMCVGSAFGRRVINFPGGEFKPEEDAQQALVREISEEVGIEVGVVRLLHTSNDKVFTSPDIANTRMMNHYFLVTADTGKVDLTRRAPEVDALKWISVADLPLPEMLEVDRAFVEVLKNSINLNPAVARFRFA